MKSKLDPFKERIRDWQAEGKNQIEIRAALAQDGCSISAGRLSVFLSAEHEKDLQEKLFGLIATGGQMNRELDSAFEKNPAPDIERLIAVTKTLVMSLQIKGNADPSLLDIADRQLRTVLDFIKERGKEEDRKLAREKFLIETDRFMETMLKKAQELLSDNSLTQADRIAAMRKAAFADVEALRASGKIQIPKA